MIKTADLKNEIIDLTKEMTLLDNENLLFSSLLLRKGVQKVGSVIVDWKYENLDNSRGTALEGADITTFQTSNRSTGDKNICQIIEKAVSVSGTSTAVSLESIDDLFVHEISNRTLEAKRDLEHFLINGIYTEESGLTPRQMRGLVSFADANKVTGELSITTLNEMAKGMRQAGTSSQNLLLLCDYNTTDIINTLFIDKERYTNVQNEFGSVVNRINLTYGSAIVYTVDAMPVDTCMLVNMDYLKLAQLRPLHYEELSKTGDSRKGFIVMENTLKVVNPYAIKMFKKLA